MPTAPKWIVNHTGLVTGEGIDRQATASADLFEGVGYSEMGFDQTPVWDGQCFKNNALE